jgi:hypothetical protein
MITRGPKIVSSYSDNDGNYRAINAKHPGFVGYGQTPAETKENLSRAIRTGERANPLACALAAYMVLSPDDQRRFDEERSKIRQS